MYIDKYCSINVDVYQLICFDINRSRYISFLDIIEPTFILGK
jgi:hypothetical protein